MQKMPKRYYAFFTLPTLIAFVVAFFIPFLLGIYLSFTTFTTVTNSRWAGVSNYVRAFSEDNNFINATIFTVKFAIVSVILINILAFGLALLFNKKNEGREWISHSIFHAEPYWGNCSRLYLVVDHQWYPH